MEQKAEACYKERKNAWIHTLERAKAMRYGLFVGGEGGGEWDISTPFNFGKIMLGLPPLVWGKKSTELALL